MSHGHQLSNIVTAVTTTTRQPRTGAGRRVGEEAFWADDGVRRQTVSGAVDTGGRTRLVVSVGGKAAELEAIRRLVGGPVPVHVNYGLPPLVLTGREDASMTVFVRSAAVLIPFACRTITP